MKLLTFVITTNLLFGVNYISFYSIIKKYNLNTQIICKNGYLTLIAVGKINNVKVKLENLYCKDISQWDGDCISEPIKCKKD